MPSLIFDLNRFQLATVSYHTYRDNSGSEYCERKYLIQPKLMRNWEYSVRNFNKILS